MDKVTLLETLAKGEDTHTQFKENIHNPEQLAQEVIAFSNSLGGTIIIGVTDKGEIKGLADEDIRRLNQMISNASSEYVKPPVFPKTEIIVIEDRKVLLVHIPYGFDKPYCTGKGVYYTKSGSDKRKVSQDELRRLFQESGKLYADEMIFKNAGCREIDLEMFKRFHEKKYGVPFEGDEKSLPQVLENLNLASNGFLNLAGLLLFGKNPMKYIPLSQVIAVSFVLRTNFKKISPQITQIYTDYLFGMHGCMNEGGKVPFGPYYLKTYRLPRSHPSKANISCLSCGPCSIALNISSNSWFWNTKLCVFGSRD